MKHNWEVVEADEYSVLYRCSMCKRKSLVNQESPTSSALPSSDCVPSVGEISKEIARLEKEVSRLHGDINTLRSLCSHPRAEKEHRSNTGNWCRQDDCYWTEFDCPDCKKHWTEEGSL